MNDFVFLTAGEIEVAGTRIFIDFGLNDANFRGRDDVVYMAKSQGYLHSYREINAVASIDKRTDLRILELGIFKGGSAIFFDKFYEPKQLVCIDYMKTPARILENYIAQNGGGRIHSYYGINQADKSALNRIIEKEFDAPIDLVIDDASHSYEESRASFEAIFPYLAAGGIYVIEDWSWAHNEGAEMPNHFMAHKTSLTNLILRLVMLHGADNRIIRRIGFTVGLMWVQKGIADLPHTGFTLEKYERPRGRELSLI